MSTRKRVLLLALGMFQCFATSGIIYGWTSLDQLFVNEGVYSNLCPPGNQTCSAQNLRFNLIFTISSNINLAAGLLMGYILDRWGPRACVVQSMACVLGGCICVAFGSPTLDLYMAGMILIGFGGPGIQNGLIHLSNLFPNHKSLATCLITGSFQLSFAVFLVFEKIQVAGATHQTIFLGFSGLVLALIASSIFFWPPRYEGDGGREDWGAVLPGAQQQHLGRDISCSLVCTSVSPPLSVFPLLLLILPLPLVHLPYSPAIPFHPLDTAVHQDRSATPPTCS